MTAPVARSAHRVASRALDWLGRFHTLATFPAGTTAELADPDSTYKPLGETALVASLVLREGVAGPRQAHTARELLDFAWDASGVTVSIENAVPPGTEPVAARGARHGIPGMRERAQLTGGTLAIDTAGDRFRVTAKIPVQQGRTR